MADLYGTPAGFKSYCDARGNTSFDASTDAAINAALLVVSEWIDGAYRPQFMGYKVGGRDQIREWPRDGIVDIYGYYVDNGSVPREVENATYEGAIRQMTTPGVFFKDYTPSKYKSVAISGSLSVDYAMGSAYDFQTQMPAVAAALQPILDRNVSGSNLSGAAARA